jgi:predicted NBD/HSP70 family sugar kinase
MRRETHAFGTAARPDAIRRHNLGLLLGHVHRDGELTRAELTQRLGMSRSTIGALVAELVEQGYLLERVPTGGASGAGRPSFVVAPRPDGPYAIAVDVDVTELFCAAVGLGGTILARREIELVSPPTPQDVCSLVLDAVDAFAKELPASAWPVGLGLSLPGIVSRDGTIVLAPNLDWHDVPLGRMLADAAPKGIPVIIANDADVAVTAERLRGAARGMDDVIYLIGRVGVGAGIIADGRALHGRDGHAGEVGHNVVDPAGPKCHCGKRGCVETYIGDKALLRLAGRRRPPTLAVMERLFDDAASGDAKAADAIRTVARDLGRTISSLVNVLNPETVILGGTLADVFSFAGEVVQAEVTKQALPPDEDGLKLVLPGLGADSMLLGAAERVFDTALAAL